MEEVFNENEMMSENQDSACMQECDTPEAKNANNTEAAKTARLLKTGIAMIFASSLLTTGVTMYQLLAKDKDNNDTTNKPSSTIGSVSNKTESVSISDDGYWVINGVKTDVKAEAQDGENGEDAIYVKEARVIYNDQWHISSYIQFVMSDNSYVNTRVQTNVLNDHYYEATSADDVAILVENYGVSKIRLANNIELSRKLNLTKRLTVDLNDYKLTYSSVNPISLAKDVRLTFERGTLAFNNDTGIVLSGDNSLVRFEEVNVEAKSAVAEVIGANASIKLTDSKIETVEDLGEGYLANNASTASLFNVYGANFNIELKESVVNTILNVVEVDDYAQTVNISIKNSEINSTASLLNIDTSAVVPTISLDDNTLENLTVYEFNTSELVSGNFNFNPEEAELAEHAFSVNGKWVVAESFADLVNKVEAGSVINLTENLVVTKGAVVTKELTLNLGNYTISGPEVAELAVIEVNLGGKLTINAEEGGINSASQNNDCSIAVWARAGGEAIINGGFYTNYGAASVFKGVVCNNELIYTSGDGSKITINDGFFMGNSLNEKWGTRYALNKHDTTNSNIVVNGGFFYDFNPEASLSENPVANFVAEGKIVVSDGETYAVITKEEFAEYAEFEEINYISLHTDLDLADSWIITHTLTLNLNGHTITRTNNTENQTIRVNAGGDLTINGEGTINGVGKSDYAIALRAHEGGKITINGGTYTNEGAGDDEAYDLIYASKGGVVVINGGTFKGTTPNWLLNLQDNTGSSIVVNGGTFVGYNPAESHTENPVANFVAEGYVVVEKDGVYTVVAE